MKKFSLLLLAVFGQLLAAQGTRFIYEVTSRPDSTDHTAVKTELAYLDVFSDKSVFYPQKRVLRDSVMTRMRQTGNFNFDRELMSQLRTDLNFIIEKDASGKVQYKAPIAMDTYQYEEDRPINWNILPETTTVGEYKAQKAETMFAGRTWYAWFTTEIPFPDGPYKFKGLPGLIVKAEDKTGSYSFDLLETRKMAEPTTFSERRAQTIPVKREVFQKQMAKWREDPMSMMNNSRVRITQISPPAPRGETQKETRRNNPIELE